MWDGRDVVDKWGFDTIPATWKMLPREKKKKNAKNAKIKIYTFFNLNGNLDMLNIETACTSEVSI